MSQELPAKEPRTASSVQLRLRHSFGHSNPRGWHLSSSVTSQLFTASIMTQISSSIDSRRIVNRTPNSPSIQKIYFLFGVSGFGTAEQYEVIRRYVLEYSLA